MLAIRSYDQTGITVIDLGKRLTLQNADELLRAADNAVQPIAPYVVINAQHLTTLDSSGIGALVTINNRVRRAKGRLAIAGLRPEVRRMLTLMNLHQVIEMFETEDLAKKALILRRV